ncbi:MAG: polysaccharide deacetylase family protein [Xanthobacteraceae bacterium]
MRKAWAGFLVTALAAASTMAPCSGSAFAQQLSAQAAAGQSAPEAAASQSAQQPAGQPAANCPGHPDALGTSRVLALDPAEYPRIGRMHYPDSLPLADKEVVLTFDDGPILPYSDQILDILASQCVKATYFLVGEMARAFPAAVRRIYEEGHTIGTHSEDHPTRFGQLPVEKMRHEIDWGISDVSAALGDPKYLAPFFRIPGLARSDVVESELAARGLTVFSSDTDADDWYHRITGQQIIGFGHAPTGSARQGHSASSRHPSGDRRRPPRAPQGAQGQRFPYCASGPSRVLRDRDGEQAQSAESSLNGARRGDNRQRGESRCADELAACGGERRPRA